MDCIFCKIANGEIPCTKVFEDENVIAFYDLAPAAPVHVLIIPKEHVSSGAVDIDENNASAVAEIFKAVPKITEKLGLTDGFRVVTNSGSDAGQTVGHLHFHILGGGPLGKMA